MFFNWVLIDIYYFVVWIYLVIGFWVLNVNFGFVMGFVELKKYEGDKILDFLNYYIYFVDDYYV